jgi:hypothetical protein
VFNSKHNSNSPLLCLPGELRNQIYEYAFGGHLIEFGHESRSRIGVRYCYARRFGMSNWSDLLSQTTVCRQIYEEMHLLPFALNTVFIDMFGGHYANSVQELGKSQKSAIPAVCFRSPWIYGLDDALQALDDCTGLSHITIHVDGFRSESELAKIQAFANKRGIELKLEGSGRIVIKLEPDIED